MLTTPKQLKAELASAKKDLATFTAMRRDLGRVIVRLEKRLLALDKAVESKLRSSVLFHISNGIQKAEATKHCLDDQISYMENIVDAIKQHQQGPKAATARG
jgi:uncharacterized protein (DUF342 family)